MAKNFVWREPKQSFFANPKQKQKTDPSVAKLWKLQKVEDRRKCWARRDLF